MKFISLRIAGYMLALLSFMTFNSCKRDSPKDTKMVLTSFTPEVGSEGGIVVLTGKNFSSSKESNTVKFNGVIAAVTEAAADGTSLTVTIPENATTGKITVKTGDQEVVSSKDFVVNPLAPAITGFTPDHGAAGTIVVITGKSFAAPAKVFFGELEGTDVIVVSKTRIEVKAPADLVTGKIRIECNGLEGVSAGSFYGPLAVTTIEPKKAEEDSLMYINGSNFDLTKENNIVKFGTVTAEVVEATSTKLRVKVPAGAAGGKISVTVNNVSLETSDAFTLLPTIVDFSPKHGEPGSTVVVTGKNFSATAVVRLGTKTCPVTQRDPGQLTITVANDPTLIGERFAVWNSSDFTTHKTVFEMTNVWKWIGSGGGRNLLRGTPFAIGNKFYIIGGWNDGTVISSFDVTTKTWDAPVSLPSDLRGVWSGSVFVMNNKAYMGNFLFPVNPQWYEFDPALSGTNQWRPVTSAPNSDAYGGVALNINNRLFNFLGLGSSDVNEFNPAAKDGAGEWTNRVTTSITHQQYGSGFVINGIGYFGGGVNADNATTLDFYKYDPATNATAVTKIANMLDGTQFAPAYALNGKGYVLMNELSYQYDPGKNEWTRGKFQLPITFNFAQVINNKVYAMSNAGTVYEYIPNK
ncbi:MAG: IPT/TIG domain-containing protein [Pseudobacter sp.]|uniref:IPT/TIG domain-containing protein n=1 Tax=Pseudobacter sp. TaxID=2045420 RepID=UPI003F7D2A3A